MAGHAKRGFEAGSTSSMAARPVRTTNGSAEIDAAITAAVG
jgi:hypothetical protein